MRFNLDSFKALGGAYATERASDPEIYQQLVGRCAEDVRVAS